MGNRNSQGPWHSGRGPNDGHQEAHHERGATRTGGIVTAPPPRGSRHRAMTKGHRHTKASGGPLWRRTPAQTRRCNPDMTPHKPHGVAPINHRSPHRGRRVHPNRKKGIYPHREPPKTPHNPSEHPNRQVTTLATTRATTQTLRAGARGGRGHDRDTKDGGRQGGGGTRQEGTQHSRGDHTSLPHRAGHTSRDRDPRGTRDQGTGPKGGQPHGHPTNQAESHTATPATQTQQAA